MMATYNHRRTEPVKAKKLSVYFPEDAVRRMRRLKHAVRASNDADIIRLALTVLDEQVDIFRNGGQLFKHDGDGNLLPYNPFIEPGTGVAQKSEKDTQSVPQAAMGGGSTVIRYNQQSATTDHLPIVTPVQPTSNDAA
ncbi:MAG: hypothetical protein AAFR90_13715 [Pseudomonadota bacterium]